MPEQLRFSRQLPLDAVNLAWIQIPPVTPDGNVSLIETGRYVAENIDLLTTEALGTLVIGDNITTTSVTGYVYFVSYNVPPSGSFAGDAIASGSAYYRVPRNPTTRVSPSGFVLENFTSEIRVYPPTESDIGVWRLRIKDGMVQRRHVLRTVDGSWLSKVFSPGDLLVLYYSVVEASQIPYLAEGSDATEYLDARVVDVSGVIAQVIDDHTIQLPDEDLVEVRSLRINDEELITTEVFMIFGEDGIQTAQVPPIGPFSAWDPIAGRLVLDRSISERDKVVVSYRYREYVYLYEGYADDNNFYHNLDLNPTPGHSYDQGRPTSELLNIPVYLYLLPTAAYRIQDRNGNIEQDRKIHSGLRWHRSFLRWERTAASIAVDEDPPTADPCLRRSTFGHSYFGRASFVDNLPVDTLTAATSAGTGLAYLPSALVLAKIYLTANSRVDNVQITDVRTRGGGIPESINITDKDLPGDTRKEIEAYFDIGGWDGRPVPLAGALVVEIPSGVLTGANGLPQFTQEELEEIVRSHVSAGVKPIIRYV